SRTIEPCPSERSAGLTEAHVAQLSVSPGGLPKRAVAEALVTRLGLAGDTQRNLEHHGGPARAVCLFPLEAIQALAAEGHPIVPGALGENVTTAGLDWSVVVPGARLRLGPGVLLEVTTFTSPCFNLAARGVRDVLLLERQALASGGTGRSVGIVRQLYPTPETTQMVVRSLRVFRDFGEAVGGDAGYVACGCLIGVAPSMRASLEG